VATYSNLCNCGVFTNDILTVTVPSLAIGAGTAFNIGLIPSSLGYMTNIVTALALEPDPNTNNMVTNVNLVIQPEADISVAVSASANPIQVTGDVTLYIQVNNAGPSDAPNVMATNVLPSNLTELTNQTTATTGSFTNVNGSILWNIGTLKVNSSATLALAAQAVAPGTVTDMASAFSSIPDPNKGNNLDFFKIEVDPQPMLSVSRSALPVQLTWNAPTNFILQGATSLTGPWTNVPMPMPDANGNYTFAVSGTNGSHFYRLKTQ
jgi:uncharacterized repeat protein (TIGR01451 family)